MAATSLLALVYLSHLILLYGFLVPLTSQFCVRNGSSCYPAKAFGAATTRAAFRRRLTSFGFAKTKFPATKSGKHGTTSLVVPGHDPPVDITIFLDVSINPGPDVARRFGVGRSDLEDSSRNLCRHLHNHHVQNSLLQYSRDQLLRFRRCSSFSIREDPALIPLLKENGIFRYRGRRSGNRVQQRRNSSAVSLRSCNHSYPRRKNSTRLIEPADDLHIEVNTATRSKPKASVPSLLISNTRSLTRKVDELEWVARHNNADVICVTESWLTDDIPDSAIAMDDFIVFRKDRSQARGGGLVVYVNCTIPCKVLSQFVSPNNTSECLWLQLRPRRLPRSVSSVLLAVIYHPPHATSQDNNDLYNHVQTTTDSYSLDHPECLVCVVGDFNPTSTNISPVVFKRQCGLTQIIKVLTRDTGILDWCLTNSPKVFSSPKQLPKIGSSDHYSVLVAPVTPSMRPTKLVVSRRDTRDSRIREFGRWLTLFVWDDLYALGSCEEKFDYFYKTLHAAVDRFLPVRSHRKHSSDKPWMTSKIKALIARRQKCLTKHGKDSPLFGSLRNKVQRAVKDSKKVFYERKVKHLRESNSSKWWKDVKQLSGSSGGSKSWSHQLLGDGDTESLCNRINKFFVDLTSEFEPLTIDDVMDIAVEPADIPRDLLVSPREAGIALRGIKVRKSPGPDDIPNIVLKTFDFELAPVIAHLYNASLKEGFLPVLFKRADVRPLPKQMPPKTIENDIRPVSLTSQLAKVMEGFTLTRIAPPIIRNLDPKQFAVEGKCTTHAIVFILHIILESLDRGGCAARLFFADFRKGFDLIDHKILLDKLAKYKFHNCLLRWVASFLQGRSQFVTISSVTSKPLSLNGGIPQGTKIGPLLFAVMVNELVSSWSPRAKFVDDLTIVEIVPRNSPSFLNFIVEDIIQYAIANHMKLNPPKCKEMLVDFLRYNSCVSCPIVTGNAVIEQVASFKFLGVNISRDLTWDVHVDYLLKKVNKRLYILRVLRRCGAHVSDMVKIYCAVIRSVMEYASPAFANLSVCLSNALERVQKRALSIMLPGVNYREAMEQTGLATLEKRREEACEKFMQSLKMGNPLLPLCRGMVSDSKSQQYNLRSRTLHKKPVNTVRFETFVSYKYLEYSYV